MIGPSTQGLVTSVALEQGIPVEILWALVEQESRGNPDAWRPEPDYKNLARPFPLTDQSQTCEVWQQRSSWGLAQVMGATARRFGFRGPFLTQLCREPRLSLLYGCIHLRRDLDSGVQMYGALCRYNGGMGGNPRPDGSYRNAAYADKVLRLARKYA